MRVNAAAFKIIALLTGFVLMISAGLPSQQKFKNLKVLPKNISEKQLDKLMDEYCHALNVGCDYCHAKLGTGDLLDVASDKKPEKEMARKMISMTNTINAKYFNVDNKKSTLQAVSCMTCHREKPRPEIEPDAEQPVPPPVPVKE